MITLLVSLICNAESGTSAIAKIENRPPSVRGKISLILASECGRKLNFFGKHVTFTQSYDPRKPDPYAFGELRGRRDAEHSLIYETHNRWWEWMLRIILSTPHRANSITYFSLNYCSIQLRGQLFICHSYSIQSCPVGSALHIPLPHSILVTFALSLWNTGPLRVHSIAWNIHFPFHKADADGPLLIVNAWAVYKMYFI